MGEENEGSKKPEPAPKVRVKFLGGPVHGHELSFLEAPLFIGIGTMPISRYEPVPGNGEVLSYRFVEEP